MASPLQRLYQTKLALLATISTVVGLALLMVSHWLSSRPEWSWFAGLINDVGASLFTIGLLGIFFQYVGAEDQEQVDDDRVRRMLKQTAPDIRNAVVEGFAFAPDSLTSVASPKTLDRIVENCLAIQVGDPGLARDAYAALRDQLVETRPRCHDARVSVVLSPWEGGPVSGSGSMFVATIKWEYSVLPSSPIMRFSGVSNLVEYRELLDDPAARVVWYFEPVAGLDGSSTEAFQLLQCAVDGKPLRVRRSVRAKSQIFTVDIGPAPGTTKRPVQLSYAYRVLVQKNGHLLHLDIAEPTKGLRAEFWYGDCDIRWVNVLDYIAGAGKPRITQLPASDPTPSVEISYDGWVFPKGGLAFVWVLESEVARRSASKVAALGDGSKHHPLDQP
jgi:hypothetical protein